MTPEERRLHALDRPTDGRYWLDGEEVSHRDIDWACRWVVQAHWRHIESYEGPQHHAKVADGMCTVCGARCTHIRAYVKGPDGAPLKAVPELAPSDVRILRR